MITLFIKKGIGFEEKVYDASECIIGRGEECNLVLSGKGLSRNHCKITIRNTTATIEDLGSSNGTFVNGVKIEGVCELSPGDKVSLGEDYFYFQSPPALDSTGIFIQVLSGPHEGQRCELQSNTIVIGRRDCDFTLPEDGGTSMRHVIIEPGRGGWVARDLGSSNGLWLNKMRVDAVKLSENHVFRIGKSLIFVGTEEELSQLEQKKNLIKRDMNLAKYTPYIAAAVLLVVASLVFMFKPKAYKDNRINLLPTNSSFEEKGDGSLPGWTPVLQAGLDVQLVEGGGAGDYALEFLGAQHLGNPLSRLEYAQDIPVHKGNTIFTLKAGIKTELKGGVFQMALSFKDAQGNQHLLRGYSRCATSAYTSKEECFRIPEGVTSIKPVFVLYGIEGKILLDDVGLFAGGNAALIRSVSRLHDGEETVEVDADGTTHFYEKGEKLLADLQLVLTDKGEVVGSQEMGYLEKSVRMAGGSINIYGVMYDKSSNSFIPYAVEYRHDIEGWIITPRILSKNARFGMRILKAGDTLEAFGPHGQSVLISNGITSQALGEIVLSSQPMRTLTSANSIPFLFTLHDGGISIIEATREGDLFSLAFLRYSPRQKKIVTSRLEEAHTALTSKNYAEAHRIAKDIVSRYPHTRYAEKAQKIIATISSKAAVLLKSLVSESKHIKVDMPEHKKKIIDFYTSCRKIEAQFDGLEVAKEARMLREDLEARQRDYKNAEINKAANKVAHEIKRAIAKDNFVMAGVLLGSLEREYPTSDAFANIDSLRQLLKARKDLKKAEQAYINARYAEIVNFERNHLYSAIKRVYEDILLRYPDHAETKERLKRIEEKIKQQDE